MESPRTLAASPTCQTSPFVFEGVAAIQIHDAWKRPRHLCLCCANPTLGEVKRTPASLERVPGMIRLSPGVEDAEDLVSDLDRALGWLC